MVISGELDRKLAQETLILDEIVENVRKDNFNKIKEEEKLMMILREYLSDKDDDELAFFVIQET